MILIFFLLRITVVFSVLLFLTRILGKKQMSQLTFFNYITGITIGSISANIIYEPDMFFAGKIIGLTWWCMLTGLAGYLGLKSKKIRHILDGEPAILINKGQIIKEELRKTRVNIDGLLMMLRKQGIFSVTEVEYAILEHNGELSVMKKQQKQQVTKEDMNIAVSYINHIPLEVITDGRLISENLTKLNLNKQWLEDQLKKQGINHIDEVFYAEVQDNNSLIIQKN